MRRIPIADRELVAEYADLRVQVLSLAARDTARNLESPSCTRMIGLHDSPLEGTGFEPSVPRGARRRLGVESRSRRLFRSRGIKQRRHEPSRTFGGDHALPKIRIHLPPADSPCLAQTGPLQSLTRSHIEFVSEGAPMSADFL